MIRDSFYTSPDLADTLLSFAPFRRRPGLIADFACGEGSLLFAAERRWPGATMLANDISRHEISTLRKDRPNWRYACADFLNANSVRSSSLRHHFGEVDLIVINPPFSRRDKKVYSVRLFEKDFYASIATAFVARSVPYLSPGGVLLAVLPDGSLVSTQDREIWAEMRRAFKLEIIRDNSHFAFTGVRARTCLVRMTRTASVAPEGIPESGEEGELPVIRGSCQMHSRRRSRASAAAPIVHTTHLKAGAVLESRETVDGKVLEGPALLFPRVGLVTPEKLCILADERRVVLSDCVLAVQCPSTSAADTLRRKIIEAWPTFAAGFRGTGAPYITVERASKILASVLRSAAPQVDPDRRTCPDLVPA